MMADNDFNKEDYLSGYKEGFAVALNRTKHFVESQSSLSVPTPPTTDTVLVSREWQPIETAPKDSSWILAAVRTGRQVVVRWGGGAWEDDNRLCRDPIHWMPLPPYTKEHVDG